MNTFKEKTKINSSILRVSSLTANDSKILGNSLKLKSKKLNEQTHLSSNKFKILNSSWTPLVNKDANKTVFEDRVELVSNWFDLWNDKQRKWFLLNILSKCRPSQICYIEDLFDNLGISERKDFTRVLPKYLSQYIFSFLSPKDLSRCSQVSSHWKYLSEQDEIWMPKCLKFGWYLPYTPNEREVGAWKAHYIQCVTSINAKPLSREDAFRYREILFKRELTENEKEYLAYTKSKHRLDEWSSHELVSSRPPWMPNSQKPKDLKKSDKLLYSFNFNLNQSLFGLKDTNTSISVDSNLRTLKESKSINKDMLEDFKQSLPLNILKMKESYKRMRKSESDVFKIGLTNSSIESYLNYSAELAKSNTFNSSSSSKILQYNTNPNVIFISSRLPCSYLLLESVKSDTVSIAYDFDSTDISTLLKLLDLNLNGRQAKSIALFVHFDKPGQIALVKDKLIYSVNLDHDEISNFFMKLKENMTEIDSQLDIFSPLASSETGLDLVEKIHKFTGLTLRVPTGYLGNYKYVKSKWINTKDVSPIDEYFVEDKLNAWLTYCDLLNDAHDKVAEFILNGYLDCDFNKLAIQRIIGKLVFDSLSSTRFLINLNLHEQLATLINKAANLNQSDFFLALSEELDKYLKEKKIAIETSNEENKENLNDEKKTSGEIEGVLRSDLLLRSFLKIKSEPENIEPGMRTQISIELVKSEIIYMKYLEIIQKYFARPLKATLDAGHSVISQSVIDILFSDLSVLYSISKEMVKDFNLRIKNWKLDTCICDVITKLTDNIQTYINYSNNIDSILNTIDKLVVTNPKFRTFLVRANRTRLTNMMSIQDLMNSPWPRIKDLINLLSSLQFYTPKNHADQANIQFNLNRLRQFYVYLKQVKDRLESRYVITEMQRDILDLPSRSLIKEGRYLMLKQKAVLLNKQTLGFVKEITCFVFNDGVLFAYRVRRHFPFTKFSVESLIYFDLIEDLLDLTIIDVLDTERATNVVQIKFGESKEYTIGFETFEAKFNFVKSMKFAAELI